MKYLKKYRAILVALLWLIGCWAIGRALHPNNSDVGELQTAPTAETEASATEPDAAAAQLRVWQNITVDGAQNTTGNPWNTTAGVIEVEGEGKCILLMPNTSITVENLSGTKKFAFRYRIFSGVSFVSTGAGLLLWIQDEQDKILSEQTIAVNSSDGWVSDILDLSQTPKAAKVTVHCNNGDGDDDSGDWVLLQKMICK